MKSIVMIFLIIAFQSLGSESTDMRIRASVYKPLEVQVDGDINFGIVAPGSDITKYGKIFFKGEENAIVRIEVDGAKKYDAISYRVELKSEDGKAKMPVYFNFSSRGFYVYNKIRLNWNGTSKLDMATRLIVPRNQKSGKYASKIIIKARYD